MRPATIPASACPNVPRVRIVPAKSAITGDQLTSACTLPPPHAPKDAARAWHSAGIHRARQVCANPIPGGKQIAPQRTPRTPREQNRGGGNELSLSVAIRLGEEQRLAHGTPLHVGDGTGVRFLEAGGEVLLA